MDEVMAAVARLYVELTKAQRGRVAHSKSLEKLRVEIFMSPELSGYQMNNTLSGVGGFVLKIQKERMRECSKIKTSLCQQFSLGPSSVG